MANQLPSDILGISIANEITNAENTLPKGWGLNEMPQIRGHMSKGMAKGILGGLDSPWYDVMSANQSDPLGLRARFAYTNVFNYGFNYAAAATKKNIDGTGSLRGVIKGATLGTPCIVLPQILIPAQNQIFATSSDYGLAHLEVWADGTVRINWSFSTVNPSGMTILNATWETLYD